MNDNVINKFWKRGIRTDLAIEAREMLEEEFNQSDIEGVSIKTTSYFDEAITLTWVKILDEDGAEVLGKPIGNYVTIESDTMKDADPDAHKEMVAVLADTIKKVVKMEHIKSVLVVGLGNWNVTPDSLGPKVVSKILVTRHLMDTLPTDVAQKLKIVSTITPGVMGQTGIETADTVKSLVAKTKPDLVIAIDALASRRTNRINATIQISDTGICPGAGVNNKRVNIDEESLGVPVLAIGVPTVIDAGTLVCDTIDAVERKFEALGIDFKMLNYEQKNSLVKDVLNPYEGNMFVTPKEVDDVIMRLSNIISKSINLAVHHGMTEDEITNLLF